MGGWMIRDDLKYSSEHEWVRVEKNEATVGITHYAQDKLGDVVYVNLPSVGSAAKAGKEFAEVESTKATSPIYAPLSGKVVRVNESLKDKPEMINEEPYGRGWIAVIQMESPAETDALLDAAGYERFLKSH